MKIINYCNRIIEFSFYSLFFLVPLIFSGSTSELFEFPKMWFTFAITILIGGAWFGKMILQGRIQIQRTPLDIPLLLFLLANIVSTIFSLDPHVSLWGYYSRFNGGLLSVISYVFLYYALVSNFGELTINEYKISITKIIKIILVVIGFYFLTYLITGTNPTDISYTTFKALRLLAVFLCVPLLFLASIKKPVVIKIIYTSLFSGLIVALWGLPSHFGFDLTCFIFRGTFDTSCWTEAFRPTIRIFSTLGQPAWLAAYMSILIPISISFAFLYSEGKKLEIALKSKKFLGFLVLALMFYAGLTYTDTRGGFIGFWIANVVFWGIIFRNQISKKYSKFDILMKLLSLIFNFFRNKKLTKYFILINLLFLIFNFLQGVPISQISRFTLPEISKSLNPQMSQSTAPQPAAGALGGTDSGKIRLLVWAGAIEAWRAHPVIGTGVETFAFAYYKYRPIEHNLTSEWDYLYNKAHNEYLNYLATTGVFGLGSYLAIIGIFIYQSGRLLMANGKSESTKQNHENHKLYAISYMLTAGLFAGWLSILVSNFFGFSVVIINLYFFLIPAFVFVLGNFLNPEKSISFSVAHLRHSASSQNKLTRYQYTLLTFLLLIIVYLLSVLLNYWSADISYSQGSNLDKAGSYQEAAGPLQNAVITKPNEPVYTDELSINLGTLSAAFYMQKDASGAAQFSKQAVLLNDQVVGKHPNNIVFWKNRVRLFYTLAQGDPQHEGEYYGQALKAIEKARELAPNDAKVSYNYAVLTGQIKGPKEGIEALTKTVKLKPDYKDAYFALGLYYHELATDQNENIIDPAMQNKAVQTYEYILKYIDPTDKQIKETLKTWQK